MRTNAILGASVLAALAAPTSAQSIHDYLPANTMAVFSIPDLAGSLERFQSMPLANMWHEEEVQEFVADLMDLAKQKWDEAMEQGRAAHQNGQLPVSPDELLKLRLNGTTIALTHFSVGTSEWGDPMPEIGVVAQFDFGDSADSWFKLIDMGMDMLQQQAGDDVEMENLEVGKFHLSTLSSAREKLPMSLNMARVGNTLVLGSRKADVQGVLSGLAGQKSVLAASPAYKAAASQLHIQQPEMTGFIQMDSILDAVVEGVRVFAEMEHADVDADGIARALDAMGFSGIGGSAFASAYENGECVTRGYTISPAPERRGFFAGSAKTLDMGFMRWVPKGAVSVSATTMDIPSIYDGLVAGLEAYDPQLAGHLLSELGKHEAEHGISIKEDLFGAFGDQFVSWSMPMVAMGSPPEMAFLIKVKDEKRLLSTLNTLAELSDGMVEIDDVNRRGIEAHQLRVNIDSRDMMMNPFDMFVPTFSFKEGYMVVGFSAGDVKRVFDRMDREDDPTGDIRGNKEVASLISRLPESGVTSVSFTDWKANFEGLYQVVTGVLAFLPMDQNIPVDLVLLPESSTLTKHLTGGVSYTVADGNGFTTISHSPFGPEVYVGAVVLGLGAGAALGISQTIR